MAKRIIRNRTNFKKSTRDGKVLVVKEVNGEVVRRMETQPSKFRDGQVLDNATLIKRYFHGSIVDNMAVGRYLGGNHDSLDVEQVERMDLVDQIDLYNRQAAEMQQRLDVIKAYEQKLKETEQKRLDEEKYQKRKALEAKKESNEPEGE